MLVLGRCIGERIFIGVDGRTIVLTVVSADRGKARIGIEASAEVEVHREEVWDRIKKRDGSSTDDAR